MWNVTNVRSLQIECQPISHSISWITRLIKRYYLLKKWNFTKNFSRNIHIIYIKNLKKLIAFFWKYQSREKIESKKFLFLSQTKHKTERLKKSFSSCSAGCSIDVFGSVFVTKTSLYKWQQTVWMEEEFLFLPQSTREECLYKQKHWESKQTVPNTSVSTFSF